MAGLRPLVDAAAARAALLRARALRRPRPGRLLRDGTLVPAEGVGDVLGSKRTPPPPDAGAAWKSPRRKPRARYSWRERRRRRELCRAARSFGLLVRRRGFAARGAR